MQISGTGIATAVPSRSGPLALSFCLEAIEQARAQAAWDKFASDDGFILATTTGQYLQWDQAFIALSENRLSVEEFRGQFLRQPLSDLALNIRAEIGMTGPYSVVTSACTASTQALAMATLWVQQGRCRRVLIGGVEVLCTLTVEGFRSLQLLSLEPARPFDRRRSGIHLSEGAAFLCVEKNPAQPLARVSGFGFSTDGYHMTSPKPDGSGTARAMRSALASAGLTAADIDWVHAHGTGSLHNDVSEAAAISSVLGNQVPVSSTKGAHGHALGASGALECALVVRAMQENKILGTQGFEQSDPAIAVNVIAEDCEKPLRHVLKNTLGFGGANAAVVLSC